MKTPSLRLLHRAAAAPPPAVRRLTNLDGPLSHLLAERHQAELELIRAKMRLDAFLAATQVIVDRANGLPQQSDERLPTRVREWIEVIMRRNEDREKGGPIFTQSLPNG